MAISTAGEIMDSAAALMNDAAKTEYSYVKQLPYLKIALKDFRELAVQNDFAVTNILSAQLTVPAGTTAIGFSTIPALPADLVEVQDFWQSNTSGGPYSLLGKSLTLDEGSNVATAGFTQWAWENNLLKFNPSTGAVYVKISYVSTLFTSVVDENSNLGVINSDSFLHYRIAGLLSQFVEENKERADECNLNAGLAFDRILSIEAKSGQSSPVRRRPFRGGRSRVYSR